MALATLHRLHTGDRQSLKEGEHALLAQVDGPASCRERWLLGLVHYELGDLAARDQAWATALQCSPEYIQLVRVKAPGNITLAEQAVRTHPEQAVAWFWLADLTESPNIAAERYWQGLQRRPQDSQAWLSLGRALAELDPADALATYDNFSVAQYAAGNPLIRSEPRFIMAVILTESQPDRAIELYREGLAAKPADGVRWYELGDLLAEINPQAALEAYLESCIHGDPGSHGCYGAGQMAEELGNIPLAIEYYRLSRWEGALNRAAELKSGQ